MVEKLGYVSDYFGKWHIPEALMVGRDEQEGENLIQYNDYDYDNDEFYYVFDSDGRKYRRYLETYEQWGEISKDLEEGQQIDSSSGYPYTPIMLDSRARHGSPTPTELSERNGFNPEDVGQPSVMGVSSLSTDYTNTHFTGDIATRAITRLKQQSDPWFLTVSFHSPHPPFVPAWYVNAEQAT